LSRLRSVLVFGTGDQFGESGIAVKWDEKGIFVDSQGDKWRQAMADGLVQKR
jgi:hypothetical protein